MSELGAIAKSSMGALEKAKAFDKKTNNLIDKSYTHYSKAEFADENENYDKSDYHWDIGNEYVRKLSNHLSKYLPDVNSYKDDIYGNDDDHVGTLYELGNYAKDTLHYTPEQRLFHSDLMFNHDMGHQEAMQHAEALSRLNPQQQEIYKALLPEWHKNAGSLEDAARNL